MRGDPPSELSVHISLMLVLVVETRIGAVKTVGTDASVKVALRPN